MLDFVFGVPQFAHERGGGTKTGGKGGKKGKKGKKGRKGRKR